MFKLCDKYIHILQSSDFEPEVTKFVLEVGMMDNILRLGQDPSFYSFTICIYTTLITHQV